MVMAPQSRNLQERLGEPSFGFISLGCAKNLVDSQVIAGRLIARGLTLAPAPEKADIVIVNTCSFIHDAREESVDAILSACALKQSGKCKAVLVAGCLPQRYGRKLKDALPEVDAFIGLDELDIVADIAPEIAAGREQVFRVSRKARALYDPDYPGLIFTNGTYAYLKIAEGCNHRCSFCAIPGIRGAHRSRPLNSIVKEAEALLESGVPELVLISQDTTSYGLDTHGKRMLPDLLKALGRIGGRYRVRILYGYPAGVTDLLLETIAKIPQVCNYLDIPIQHSDPEILQAMNRSSTATTVPCMHEQIRHFLPDATLRTTCLVGFPGETPAAFQRLLDFVKQARFDHLGVFAFSPEEGTKAETMRPRPRKATAEERRHRILTAQREIVRAKSRKLVGTETEVILEEPRASSKGAIWHGRSERQAPEVDGIVKVQGLDSSAAPGSFVRCVYTGYSGYDMKARPAG